MHKMYKRIKKLVLDMQLLEAKVVKEIELPFDISIYILQMYILCIIFGYYVDM